MSPVASTAAANSTLKPHMQLQKEHISTPTRTQVCNYWQSGVVGMAVHHMDLPNSAHAAAMKTR